MDNETAALGHSFGEWTLAAAATCTDKGAESRFCARCNAAETREIAPLGHAYSDGVCSRCGQKEDAQRVWYDELYRAIASAEAVNRSRYTDASVAALDQALEAARAAGNAEKQADVDAAKDALEAAVLALEERSRAVEPFRFEDVQDDSQYFFAPVYWAVENKITNGATPTTFSPDAGCTRGQVVTFLWRAKGQPEPETEGNPFTDVGEAQYYYKAVLWAVENGITKGIGEGRFSPDATCTRGQIVTFLYRANASPAMDRKRGNPFRDVPDGQYYTDAVLWAVDRGITKGASADGFSPDATCTRSQIVTFLYRAMAEKS